MAFCYRVRIKLLHVSNSQSDVIVELEAWRATKKSCLLPVKASEDRARQFQTGELSDFAPSRAVRRCLVVVPKSKTMHNERKRAGAPPHRAASWFAFFSAAAHEYHKTPHETPDTSDHRS